ncbi:VCBS repeat-containing protein [Bradyrhizobium sp. NBAIM32]|uniref:beta strand repeat-containing protein n=1 Tax=Bradyrhizobium sp. NBAIM32 TaxID=2793809 RepID=UPI001CD4AD08|nr:FG-GAP-like repeat-containing protein [Bradyrhizobium sp. NBAIM32]MCA1539953.1 VCBS repeat-containing protein [Bradyrhizobium sp. NBAIM32]
MTIQAIGSEFLVNATTANDQSQPIITGLADGRFVVAWIDFSQTGGDTSSWAVRAQVFNADGTPAGSEFLVNTTTASDQIEPTITALADGRFVVAWTDDSPTSGAAVRAQVFNADGTPSGSEFLVNTVTTSQVRPAITALADGRFVIAWDDFDAGGYEVRAQIFNADGTPAGSEFLVNTTTASNQVEPVVTALAEGRFVVAWMDVSETGGDTSSWAVRAQVFNADGAPSGSEFLVNTTTASFQYLPTITALTDGRFVVAWTDDSRTGGDTSGLAVRAQILNADGAPSGSELLVNSTTAGNQSDPTITALADGHFVIAWTDDSQTGGDTSSWAVRAQVFDADGVPSGPEFLVNTTTAGNQVEPAITALADGRFVVTWTDASQTGSDTSGSAVRAQIFELVPDNQAPAITSNGGGDTAGVSVAENMTAVATVTATDPDPGQTLTYAIAGGADASLFNVDHSTGALSFNTAPDFEAPLDAGSDNVYAVTVQVSDGNGGTDTQAIAVTVGNDNEAPTFVGDGMTRTAIGPADDFGRGVAVQPDGKILVAGSSFNGTGVDFAVVRYDVDGRLDTTFGSNGKVVSDFGGADDNGYSVVVNPNGKILVAGYTGSGADSDFAIVRFNADGSLDTGFGDGGKVITDLLVDDFGQSVALQSDGSIVVSGYSFNGSSFDFAIVRYSADGSLDTTFNGDGRVTTAVAFHDASYSVALQPDGKIIAAGHSFTGNGPNDFAIVRYNPDGSLDTSFGGDGTVTTDFGGTNDVGQSVAVQADGKIVVAGISQTGPNADIAVVRYNADGSLDTSFAGDGTVRTSVVAGSDVGSSVTIQPDGKILVAGNSFNGSNTDFTLVRYNTDGSLDTTFGIGGTVTTQIGAGSDEGYSVKLQPDGKILVSGYSSNGSNADFALLRYNADGSLDTTFGAPDLLSISIAENTTAVATLAATDPEAGQALTYAITGGEDASKFVINADTGALSFASAPNFEAPTDADGDNVYRVTVQVSDGSGATNTQAVAVTVTDVDDIAPTVMSVTRSDDTPTNAQTVHYTVTFSEAVTGVDASQFSLTTTGALIGAGIASVTPVTGGDGAQYVVIVDTGSGDGTVALGVTGAEVRDLAGNPLAGGAFQVISSISGIAGHVASGDLSGDGKQDLVSESSSGEISVMLGNGDGTFQEPVNYAAGHDLNSVSIADVDNDGLLDLAISNAGANGAIALLLGNGDGTFQSAISSPTNRAHSSDSALADLNGDGRLDVLVANTGENGGVSVLLGNGDGSFSLSTVLASNADPLGVAAADLNGDGIVDVAFSNVPGAFGIQIYLGTGDGTFTAAPNVPAATHTASVALEDLDHDTDTDLVFSSYDGTVSVALGNGDGSFQAPFSYTLGIASDGVAPGTVTLANVNGDTALDLVYANPLLASVSVLLGNGDGTFQSQQLFATGGTQPGWTAVDDFTGDGRLDIAVANFGSNSISILQDSPPAIVGDAYAIDKNDTPAITSDGGGTAASIAIAENTTAVTTVTAADPDNGQTLTYTIAGGSDANLFTIDANTGVLSFNAAPDFERPIDADANNVYDVIVQVSDGNGGTDMQAIAATVQNVAGISLTGNGAANTLTGTGEEDTLSGQGGSDTLLGLAGNDELDGGAGGDLLDGGAGNDSMAGGAGNDAYVMDSSEDVVVENAGEGTDTIRTALAVFTLSGIANVENLTFVGTGDFAGTGNALANIITGGAGNDTLDGAGGADRLAGLAGNDTYLVDNSSDVVVEAADAGTDTVVVTSTTYSLSANIENLTYGGTGSFNGTGNGLANTIAGGSSADTLSGAGGNDTIIGAGGNDAISGGAGDDMFVATAGDGNDNYTGNGGNDTYSLAGLSADAVINLTAGTATSSEIGTDSLTSVENVVGGSGQDTITASNARSELFGGAGNDMFIFASTAAAGFGTNRDLIIDFTAAADRIDVGGIDANGGQAGNPEFVFVGEITNVVGGVGQLGRGQLGYHYETDANGTEHTIVEGSVDSDPSAEFQIDLVGRHTLSVSDFVL